MSRNNRALMKEIESYLRSSGRGKVRDIAAALGEVWLAPRANARLRNTLGRMVSSGALRLKAGWYSVPPNRRSGVDSYDTADRQLFSFITRRGGIVERKDIARNLEDAWDEVARRRFNLILKKSGQYFQDFGPRIYNLSEEQRRKLPLPGRWAKHLMVLDWDEHPDRRLFPTLEEQWNDHCERVGAAFDHARGDMDIADVVKDPEVSSALAVMAEKAPGARRAAWDGVKADVAYHAALEGNTDPVGQNDLFRRRVREELPQHLYLDFEAGKVVLHRFAPAEMYWAAARLFGVCPAALSRGRVVHVASGQADGLTAPIYRDVAMPSM